MILKQLSRKHILIVMAVGVMALLIALCIYATTGAAAMARHPVSSSSSSSSQSASATSFGHLACHRPVDTTNSTLELVHIVFRHGARTPVDTYPKDPYVDNAFHPTGWGHVTNKGKRELFELGALLHQRYGHHLGDYYSPDFVHAQATASPRALMSLATVLASMFPPRKTPMDWQPGYDWQPIPIFSEPLDDDTLLLVRKSCPRYFEARDEVLQRPEVRAELAAYADMLANLTELTGMTLATAEDVNSLYITLLAEKEFGFPLPAWTKKYFPERMQFLAEQSYIYNAYTAEMQRIKGGPFLGKMYAEMQAKRAHTLSPSERKLFIYAGHDWTVGNILSALGVWQRQMPRFAVMAIFELHKHHTSGEYYVEIFLRNDEKGCLRQLKVPNCDVQCPLDTLIALSGDVLPSETHEQRCRPHNVHFVAPTPRPIDQH